MQQPRDAELKALADSTDDLLWSVDCQLGLVAWNRAFEQAAQAFGSQPLFRGMQAEQLLQADDAAFFRNLMQRALELGTQREQFQVAGGHRYLYCATPLQDGKKLQGLTVVGYDMTRRLDLEHERQMAEQRYQSVFENAIEGIFLTTLFARPLAVNPAFAAMLGYDSAGQFLATIRNGRRQIWKRPAERRSLLRALRHQNPVRDFECEFLRRDGSSIWVLLHARMSPAGDGLPTRLEGFCQDLTGRRLAEQARATAETQYREMFNRAQEGICRMNWTGHVLDANPSMARMLGFESVEQLLADRDAIAGRLLLEPEQRAALGRRLDQDGVLHEVECRVRRLDGSPVWVSVNLRRVPAVEGRAEALEGFFQDIQARKSMEEQLRASEERYRASFEQAGLGMAHTGFDGTLLRCNRQFAAMLGYEPEELAGRKVLDFTHPDDIRASDASIRSVAQMPDFRARMEKRYLRKDGTTIWVNLSATVQHDEEGHPQHFITQIQEISAQKEAEQKLAATKAELGASEERYRIAFHTTLDAVNINRLSDGMYVECNPAFLGMVGFSRDEVIGKTSLELNIWADPADRDCMAETVRQTGVCRNLEAQFRKRSGELFWGMMTAARVDLNGEPCVLTVTRDMSEAKMAEEEIRTLAFYDPLTALPNRRLLLERLKQVVAGNHRTGHWSALLFVDLDNFKTLNDTLGHHHGDLLLKTVGERLSETVRQTDTVARLGGDEFVVMLENLSENAEDAATLAGSVAEGVLAAVAAPCLLDGYECSGTCSIGITVFGSNIEGIHEILKQADIAMYKAKAAGRNTLRFFAPELQSAVTERAALEDDLRQAIREEQFELWYQPQVAAGRLIGAEALLRWRHPRRGILSPGEFISLAEESGQIVQLGTWALEAACQQIAEWSHRPGLAPITVAVNISARQFRQPDFVDRVLDALERSGANAESLTLELTESMLVENVEEVIGKMTALKLLGVHFALDDFGTGYSSLAYLKRLPLDQLKIDRSFVQDILDDSTSCAIAQTIVSLSRAMNLSVLAEGVETEDQRRMLERLDCHVFQGYLFSRPLPACEFDRLPVTLLTTQA